MKAGIRTIVIVAIVAVSFGATAFADVYPIAPPGTFVTLNRGDFIHSVPQQTPGLPVPNPVIGDNIGQHPGAFAGGFPPVGTFFVGVFGADIDTRKPGNAIYLWETTGAPNPSGDVGPQVELGFWNGAAFFGFGAAQTALYIDTGVPGTDPTREITSGIIPLSDFGVTPGFRFPLNAVRIEAVDFFAHNQVTAVATNLVPEPPTVLLLGACTVALGYVSYRRKRRSISSR